MKLEAPPFNMIIEGGRLVPATAYDQERLDSYRRGTKIRVRFTEEKDRVLVRKWWAVLGLVVKQCKTPWKNKDEASEAVKLALGIVNLTKTVGGDFLAYPKSLTELEDPELTDAVEQMTELLSRLTGVDVATLKKETAHVGEEGLRVDPDTGEITENTNTGGNTPSLPAGDDESVNTASSTAASQSPPSDDGQNDGPAESNSSVQEEAGSSSPIPEKELLVLRRFAKDVLNMAAKPETSGELMSKVIRRWSNMELASLSTEGKAIAKSINVSVKAIMDNDVSLSSAVEFHSEGLACEPDELMVSDNG